MAVDMKRIYGTNNAFEYSAQLSSSGTVITGDEVFVPSNVASVTMGIKRTAGTGGYKVQVSYSPKDDINGTSGLTPQWFDWDIPGLDASGYMQDAETQWWIPVPSYIRFVVEDNAGTSVYFSMRAN